MDIDTTKTLEELENDYWPEREVYETSMIKKVYNLRKIPLNKFIPNDLRLLIGQKLDLEHLIPLAIEILKDNPYTMGEHYPGDLLKNVLDIESDYWKNNLDKFDEIKKIMNVYKRADSPEANDYFVFIEMKDTDIYKEICDIWDKLERLMSTN